MLIPGYIHVSEVKIVQVISVLIENGAETVYGAGRRTVVRCVIVLCDGRIDKPYVVKSSNFSAGESAGELCA